MIYEGWHKDIDVQFVFTGKMYVCISVVKYRTESSTNIVGKKSHKMLDVINYKTYLLFLSTYIDIGIT